MKALGKLLATQRKNKNYTLSEVGLKLGIDAAILSKIERSLRKATRAQVKVLANFYGISHKAAFTAWLSDKILYELQGEPFAQDAFIVAEEAMTYAVQNNNPPENESIVKALQTIDTLHQNWVGKKPLNATQLLKMQEYFNVAYTFNSNLIEGNTLTMQETHLVVNEGLTISGKSVKEHLEAVNHYEAIDFIYELVQNKEPLTERVLKEIHYLILKSIDRSNAGVYRKVPVIIPGSSHKPPQPYLLDKQMEDVFMYYNSVRGKIHPVLLAAQMHQKIVTIHPFIDGNGRTCRLIMNLILLQNGFTIANLKGDNISRKSYYEALELAHQPNNQSVFNALIINTAIQSLQDHLELAG